MCMGLAIEFTAHVAAAFSHAEGALAQRIGKAMAETFPAIFEGSISTLLSILPMAFSATFGGTMFEVKYFFGSFALVVAVGMLNGFICLPGLLVLLSSLMGERAADMDEAPAEAAAE